MFKVKLCKPCKWSQDVLGGGEKELWNMLNCTFSDTMITGCFCPYMIKAGHALDGPCYNRYFLNILVQDSVHSYLNAAVSHNELRKKLTTIPHACNSCVPHFLLKLKNPIHQCLRCGWALESKLALNSIYVKGSMGTNILEHRHQQAQFYHSLGQLSSCSDNNHHHLHNFPC